jgi:hypothetical protein
MIQESFRSKKQQDAHDKLLNTVYLIAFSKYGSTPFNISELRPLLQNNKIKQLYRNSYTASSGMIYNVTSHGDRYKRVFVQLQTKGYATVRIKENRRIECTLIPIDKLSANKVADISVELF